MTAPAPEGPAPGPLSPGEWDPVFLLRCAHHDPKTKNQTMCAKLIFLTPLPKKNIHKLIFPGQFLHSFTTVFLLVSTRSCS